MKIKVPRATLEGMGKFIAEKAAAGALKAGDHERILAAATDDNPDLFGEHAAKTRASRPGASTGRSGDAADGLREWRSGVDAALKGGDDSFVVKHLRANAGETIQKAYEAVIATEVGDMDMDQITDERSLKAWRKLHDLHDGFTMAAAVIKDFDPRRSSKWPTYARLVNELVGKVVGERVMKIMTTAGSGTGLEFIPSTMSGSLVPLIKQALVLGDLFEHVNMPTSPWKLPIEGADNLPYLVAESTSDNPDDSNNAISVRTKATANTTITAKKLGVRTLVSAEESEDSIIDAIAYARAGIARSMGEGIDAAIMNGDDLGSLDVDSAAASDPRRAWKGLRKLTATGAPTAVVDGGASGGLLTATKLVNLVTKFGKFAQILGDSTFIVSPIGYAHLCGDTAFNRFDARGDQQVLVNGQVGMIYGRPTIISGYVREDLNHIGSYDGSGTTKTIAMLVHRPSFKVWDRRLVTIKSAELIQSDRVVLVALWRGFFGRLQPESTTPIGRNVAILYNINKNATF